MHALFILLGVLESFFHSCLWFKGGHAGVSFQIGKEWRSGSFRADGGYRSFIPYVEGKWRYASKLGLKGFHSICGRLVAVRAKRRLVLKKGGW